MIQQQRRKRRPSSMTTTLQHSICTRKILCMAAAAALSSSSTTIMTANAFALGGIGNNNNNSHRHHPISLYGYPGPRSYCWGPSAAVCCERTTKATSTSRTATRLYSSSRMRKRFQNDNDEDAQRKELFGFRRAAKSVARKILPTKWFATDKEKEALERKQMVKDRVQGELDQMLKGAPLPLRMLGKFVAAPLMGKVASRVAEASYEQAETMEAIVDEARSYLINDPTTVDLIGTPIQIGQPHSQSSATTVINGKRQLRMEFVVELSGSKGSGMSRMSATNEGIGQILVEAKGKVYQVDLSSKAKSKSKASTRFGKSSSSFSRGSRGSSGFGGGGGKNNGGDDNIIEAEIIEKKSNR